MAEHSEVRGCPARDGGFRCDLREGHGGAHKATIRHRWGGPVRLHRMAHGDYSVEVNGEMLDVRRTTDGGAPSVVIWEVRRPGEHIAIKTFTTLTDVRRWAARATSSSEQSDGE